MKHIRELCRRLMGLGLDAERVDGGKRHINVMVRYGDQVVVLRCHQGSKARTDEHIDNNVKDAMKRLGLRHGAVRIRNE